MSVNIDEEIVYNQLDGSVLEGVEMMSRLGRSIMNEIIRQGIEKGVFLLIQNIAQSPGMTVEQAMEALGILPAEQEQYLEQMER